ncbi:hypothetical protein ACO0QE_003154 [Hanseniaspora vineae]
MPPAGPKRRRGGSSLRGRRSSSAHPASQQNHEELRKQRQREQLQANRLRCLSTGAGALSGIYKDQAETFPYKRRAAQNFSRDRRLMDVLTLHNVPNRRIQAISLKAQLPSIESLNAILKHREEEIAVLLSEQQSWGDQNLSTFFDQSAITTSNSFQKEYEYLEKVETELQNSFLHLRNAFVKRSTTASDTVLSIDTASPVLDQKAVFTSSDLKNDISITNSEKSADQLPNNGDNETSAEKNDIISSAQNYISVANENAQKDSIDLPSNEFVANISKLYGKTLQHYKLKCFSDIHVKNGEQMTFMQGNNGVAPEDYWTDMYQKHIANLKAKEEAKEKEEKERKAKEEREKENLRLAKERVEQEQLLQKQFQQQKMAQLSDTSLLMNGQPNAHSPIAAGAAFSIDHSTSGGPNIPVKINNSNATSTTMQSHEISASVKEPNEPSLPNPMQTAPESSATSLLQELNDPSFFGGNTLNSNMMQSSVDSGNLQQQQQQQQQQQHQPQGQQQQQLQNQEQQDLNLDDKQGNLEDTYFNDFETFDTEFGDNAFADFDPAFF